jgi:hypothetical protein
MKTTKPTKKRRAQISDGIIQKFNGNKQIYWKDIHGAKKIFNDLILDTDCEDEPTPDSKYYVIEGLINFLIADEMLIRIDENIEGQQRLKLTDKGYYTMTNIKDSGLYSKYKENCWNVFWKRTLIFVSIATFCFVIIEFVLNFFI